jgi:hypothetical protein
MNYFEPKIHVFVFKCFVYWSKKRCFPITKDRQLCTLRGPASRASLFSPVDVELPPVCGERCNIWGRIVLLI